jgi:ATP-dependent DNA helicase DinG
MSAAAPQAGLDDDLRETIQNAYRAWLAARGFTPRRGQRLMVAEIARTLAGILRDDDGVRIAEGGSPYVCVVEAGTGTGKTVAYGLGAIPVAARQGLRLVIATATVALQDQLVGRDLPDLLASTPLRFSYALAKGRGRYACPSRLDRHVSDDMTEGLPTDLFGTQDAAGVAARAVYREMLDALVDGAWDGDRERWDRAVDDRTWSGATMDHRGCTGARCSYFRDCPYFQARERVHKADVIVANHDLVLSDLALGGGVVLPPPEQSIYVFDEGHHLADKAMGHLRRFTRALAGVQTLDSVERLLGTLAQRTARDPVCVDAAQRAAVVSEPLREGLRRALALAETLPALQPGARRSERASRTGAGSTPVHRFPHGDPGPEWRSLATELAAGHGELAAALEAARERVRRMLEENSGLRDELEAWSAGLGQYAGRIEGALALWEDFATDGGAVQARWISRIDGDQSLDVEFQSSPLDAAAALTEVLWTRCHGAVVTSATLSSTDGFRRFAEATGVPEDARFLSVPSSFDYARAAELVVPAMSADPGSAQAHADEIAERLPALIDPDEATLVIFTSWRQLDTITAALPAELLGRVLSQATETKGRILALHRERVDAGRGSIIFGLASFAEGIDLPGNYCRHVIITKLPFAVPDDPVEAAIAEWLEAQGRNPFMEVAVPDAALRLKQACGRLLRSDQDTGKVTLLDPRVVTRRYGGAILDALPPFHRRIERQGF